MQVISLLWGILTLIGLGIAFFPCFGALNWIVIPFAGVGLIISIVAFVSSEEGGRGGSVGGLICCIVALFFGLLRLIAGGGIL